MPTFIKSGYWEKMDRTLKGWLNLDLFMNKYLSSANVVTSTDVSNIVALTQDEYNALPEKVDTTMYVIVEPNP